MDDPGIKEEIWLALRQKWDRLVAEGHAVKVEFNILTDPQDEATALAIDVAQNIDGEWIVQTVQKQVQEGYSVVGIEGMVLDQLLSLAKEIVASVTIPITGCETHDEELHLFMKRISSETSEIHGYVITKNGEKIGVRTNYRHYYVINEILEQTSKAMKEEYAEIQLHRDKEDPGRIYYRFVQVDR